MFPISSSCGSPNKIPPCALLGVKIDIPACVLFSITKDSKDAPKIAEELNNKDRKDSLNYLIYNTLPGTTSAATEKAHFLKDVVTGKVLVKEINGEFALELLSHMKGGPSIEVLLDLAFSDDPVIKKAAATVLKTQVFLYEADTNRISRAYSEGNEIARELLESYVKAEFFTKLPDIEEEIKVVTYIAAEGDISTDLLSPGNQAHSRADRELHGQCFISERAQKEIEALKLKHSDKRVMLIAEKGTMGCLLYTSPSPRD